MGAETCGRGKNRTRRLAGLQMENGKARSVPQGDVRTTRGCPAPSPTTSTGLPQRVWPTPNTEAPQKTPVLHPAPLRFPTRETGGTLAQSSLWETREGSLDRPRVLPPITGANAHATWDQSAFRPAGLSVSEPTCNSFVRKMASGKAPARSHERGERRDGASAQPSVELRSVHWLRWAIRLCKSIWPPAWGRAPNRINNVWIHQALQWTAPEWSV